MRVGCGASAADAEAGQAGLAPRHVSQGFLGAPCQGPPDYKLTYPYFALFIISILLNKAK